MTQQDINLAVRVGSFAYGELRKAVDKLLAELEKGQKMPTAKDKKPELKHGKMTLKQLQKHNEGLSTVELTDPNLRQLHKAMKKDGVDFSAVKDGKGKYTLFFKAKDVDTLTHAMKRYTQKLVKIENRPSIASVLAAAKKLAQSLNNQLDKVKNKSRGAR
jgi:hypothetical protein